MKSCVFALFLIASAAYGQALPRPDHIVIVIEENNSFSDVIGSKNAPYLNALAKRGALLTNFTAAHHPSQPNYIDFFAGSHVTRIYPVTVRPGAGHPDLSDHRRPTGEGTATFGS